MSVCLWAMVVAPEALMAASAVSIPTSTMKTTLTIVELYHLTGRYDGYVNFCDIWK
jgi:hypothetical protein